MTIWNEEQLRVLRKLKKELEEEEHAQETVTRARIPSASRHRSQLDDLFVRLASQEEGIQFRIDDQWVPAPLGQLDGVLFKHAVNIGVGPRKIAIGLPRVPVGISTWLAVSVMISRVAFAKTDSFGRTASVRKYPQPWILIACRERSVRDLYLSQRILFTGQSFVILWFPIFRFRRDGRIQPISLAQPNALSTPVLFYHFDNIDFGESDLDEAKITLILSEISESDMRLSGTMLERLEEVRGFLSDPKTYVFFNSFDDQLREYLVRDGYEIIDMRPSISVDTGIACVPTIMGTFSHYSCPQKVILDVVQDDHGISQSLLESVRQLVKVGEEIESTECRGLLAKWWNLWRTLKDLTIPLDMYERYRMHAQGRGSLENAISCISHSADRIHTPEARLLQLVAPVIENRLRSVYNKLAQSCPKADRLLLLLDEARTESPRTTLFVLSEKSQVDALREHFLFTDVDLLDNQVPIVHLSQAVPMARTIRLRNCVLPGVWAPWQDSTLVAVGASTITVLMYPYEASLLQTRIQEHTDECALLIDSAAGKGSYAPIFIMPPEQMQLLSAIKESRAAQLAEKQPPKWLQTEPAFTVETVEPEDKILDEEQPMEGLLITFHDGSTVVVRPHSEMLLVTEDGVENVFANTLEPGDTVAVMKGDITRSIFHSVLTRVNHLVRADARVIELWRSSVRKILFEGRDRETAWPMSKIIRSLRNLGCRRVDLTIRQWFRGTTLAPKDIEDIRRVLDLAGVQRSREVSKVVSREIEIIRTFNRRLGRRIREQIITSITSGIRPPKQRLDFEIDEAIEAVESKTIDSIEPFDGV